MAFQGMTFIYGGISSDIYDLYIGGTDQKAITSANASTNTELVFESVNGRSKNFIYGVKQTDTTLEFKMNIFCLNELTRYDVHIIDAWLFSNATPKPLIIIQDDMTEFHYNAIFSKNKVLTHKGGVVYGFSCTVICDSAYAYDKEKTISYSISGETTIKFNNMSSGINYNYPKIEFKITKANGQIIIKNESDNNRTFIMSNLSVNEIISIDEWFQIESSMGLNRLENCNKKWLRFKNGINILKVSGDISALKITHQNLKGIGS